MNHIDILNQSAKQEQLRCFNIEKHIEGTEAYNINQDIMKGLDQDEILEKAKLGYYVNPELEIVKSIWSDSLNKSEDKVEFLKSFSSDLKSRFPNGAWRTINGSHVFINNGKVIAGLGGFNKEIDKFFKEKKTLKESEKKEEKETKQEFFNLPDIKTKKDLNSNISKILSQYGNRNMASIQVEEYLNENKDIAKEWLQDKKIKSREDLKNYLKNRQTKDRKEIVASKKEDAKKWEQIKTEGHVNAIIAMAKEQGVAMDEAIRKQDQKEKQSSTKTEPETKKEEERDKETQPELTSHEKTMLENYKKDKKGFIQNNVKAIESRGKQGEKSLNDWINNAKNPEYKSMLEEVKSTYDQKKSEPERLKKDFEEKKKGLEKFKSEDGVFDVDKMLQGDVVENFKQYNEYLDSANKALGKRNYEGYIGYNDLKGKTAEINKKQISVKQAKTEEDVLKNIVSTDKINKKMSGIYYDPEGYKVATDGWRIISIKTDVGENSGKLINPKTKEDVGESFVQWKPFVNSIKDNYDDPINVKLSDIHSFSNQAEKLSKEHYAVVAELKQVNAAFDPKLLNNTIESLRKLGLEDVKLKYKDYKLSISGKNNKDQEVSAILMGKNDVKGESLKIKEK